MGEITASAFCCPTGPTDVLDLNGPREPQDAADPTAWIRTAEDGTATLHIVVDNMHCPACITTIERAARKQPGVLEARANLTTRRLTLKWREGETDPVALLDAIARLGYRLTPFDPELLSEAEDRESRVLLQALAIAGFGAGNVMMLSVGTWAGLAQGIAPETKMLLHWISALIALPCVAVAGMPFYKSALSALRHGALNMDTPISLAVLTAAGLSLYEVSRGGDLVYFDASITLLFFLLIGRYLERRVRGKARSAAENLLLMKARAAMVLRPDGTLVSLQIDEITADMVVLVAAGDHIPVDGRITTGESTLDTQMITGETMPRIARVGDLVHAGMVNLNAPLAISVTAAGEDTLLADVVRLMENAETARATYVRLADRLAKAYAPLVHILAAATFLGWFVFSDISTADAVMTALAVLIITCPCALGLAVPAVQVGAIGLLLRKGALVKSGDALEKLDHIDTVVFDKTGTLTLGRPRMINRDTVSDTSLRTAASLAAASRHPLSRALCQTADITEVRNDIQEIPGRGLQNTSGSIRLGSREFCAIPGGIGITDHAGPELWLIQPGETPVQFLFEDTLRPDAAKTIAYLKSRGLKIEILSGDRTAAVADVADRLGLDHFRAEQSPRDKIKRLEDLAAHGARVWMIGDGLNDAPALAAAHVSTSPASAADVSQIAADIVLQGDSLAGLISLHRIARVSKRLIFQNFALALGYNIIAVPLAMAGLINPLFAAVAMSASSIVVTLNSLRVRFAGKAI